MADAKALAIGSHLKLAFQKLQVVEKMGFAHPESTLALFYAAEFLVLATLQSEDIPASVWRFNSGNHQLDSMIKHIPDECSVKEELKTLTPLMAYATTHRYPSPSGKLPKYPSEEKIQEWCGTTVSLLNIFTKHFQVRVSDGQPSAGRTTTFRDGPVHGGLSI